MRINPTLVKQHARQVAAIGMLLWRHLLAAGQAGSSDSSSSDSVRVNLVTEGWFACAGFGCIPVAIADLGGGLRLRWLQPCPADCFSSPGCAVPCSSWQLRLV
jgi:hypothetical protein